MDVALLCVVTCGACREYSSAMRIFGRERNKQDLVDPSIDADDMVFDSSVPVGAALREATQRGAWLRHQWQTSEEWKEARRRSRIGIATCAISGVLAITWLWLVSASSSYDGALSPEEGLVFVVPFTVAYLAGVFVLLDKGQFKRRFYDRVVLLPARAELSAAEEQASDDLALAKLWTLTQKRLDYYHGLATTQSEKSFSYALLAAAGGLLFVIAAALVGAFSSSVSGTVGSAVLGLGGGGLAGYIGATFIKVQRASAEQLSAYFDQPLEFSRVLAAERLLQGLDTEARSLSTQRIIESLTRAPEPSDSTSEAG